MKNQLNNCTNQLLKNFEKEKFNLDLKTVFEGADLVDMQLESRFNEGFRFLLCVIDILVNILGYSFER